MQEQLSSHRTSIHSKMFWKKLVYRLKLKCLMGSRDVSGLVSHHSWSTLSSVLFLLFLPVPHPLSDLFVFTLLDFTLPRPSPKQNGSSCPRALHHPSDYQLSKTRTHSTHPWPQVLAQRLQCTTQLANGCWIKNWFSFTMKIFILGMIYIKLPNELWFWVSICDNIVAKGCTE